MRSAYSSSQCFFDANSDSIRAEDVDRVRSCGSSPPSSSFSSLAEFFRNPKSSCTLFANERTPVFFVQNKGVHFPTKKERSCMGQTSLLRERGSCECRTENVAEESSAFLADSSDPSLTSTGSAYPETSSPLSRCTCSFPTLGSASNMTSMTGEEQKFSFPARKKREVRSSWRDQRASWQDWSTTDSKKDFSPMTQLTVGPCRASSPPLTTVPSIARGIVSAVGDGNVPVEKVRIARECCSDINGQRGLEGIASVVARKTASAVSSLADLYIPKPGSRSSGLFSKASSSGSDEVIFPKRKNRADRNAWRDWMNSGFQDSDDYDSLNEDAFNADNWIRTTSPPPIPSEGKSPLTSEDVFQAIVNQSDVSFAAKLGVSHSLNSKRRVFGKGMWPQADSYGVTKLTFRNASSFKASRKFAPALRSLTRQQSQSLPVPHHMPWVQLRPIRSQGRLMLQEVKVTQPVVFQPFRSEGRLMLERIDQQKHEIVYGEGLVDGTTREKALEETQMTLPVQEEMDLETKVDLKPEVDDVTVASPSTEELFWNLSGVEEGETRSLSQVVLDRSVKVWAEVESFALDVDFWQPVAEFNCSQDGFQSPATVKTRSAVVTSDTCLPRHVSVMETLPFEHEAASISTATPEGSLECANPRAGTRGSKGRHDYEWGRYTPFCDVSHLECSKFTLAMAERMERRKLIVVETKIAAPSDPAVPDGVPRARKPAESTTMEISYSGDRRGRETAKTVSAGGIINQDGADPLWFLCNPRTGLKGAKEGTRFTGNRVQFDLDFRDRPPLDGVSNDEEVATASTDRAVTVRRNDSAIPFSGLRETESLWRPVPTPLPTASSAHSLRNGLVAGLGCPRATGEVALTRSSSKRIHYHQEHHSQPFHPSAGYSDMQTSEYGRPHASFCQQRTMTDASLYHGMLRDAVITYTFFRSLRSRPDLHGEPDHHPRLQNYVPVGAPTFSCADGIGKGHHEKNFWEQQPCVS